MSHSILNNKEQRIIRQRNAEQEIKRNINEIRAYKESKVFRSKKPEELTVYKDFWLFSGCVVIFEFLVMVFLLIL